MTLTTAAYPTTHSYHGPRPVNPTAEFQQIHSHGLSQADATEIQRASLLDTTPIHNVPFCDIFKVVTQHPSAKDIPTLLIKRIQAWKDKSFFSVTPPDTTVPLMYAPSSVTYDPCPDSAEDNVDTTRHLVLAVPKGADVRITTLEPIAAEVGDGDHYDDHDLRRDILMHCHDNAQHPRLADTRI